MQDNENKIYSKFTLTDLSTIVNNNKVAAAAFKSSYHTASSQHKNSYFNVEHFDDMSLLECQLLTNPLQTNRQCKLVPIVTAVDMLEVSELFQKADTYVNKLKKLTDQDIQLVLGIKLYKHITKYLKICKSVTFFLHFFFFLNSFHTYQETKKESQKLCLPYWTLTPNPDRAK